MPTAPQRTNFGHQIGRAATGMLAAATLLMVPAAIQAAPDPCPDISHLGADAATISLGDLTDYLFFFADGSADANWQSASKGYVGDVAVDGISASERTSGTLPYTGTVYTNDAGLDAWQGIIADNAGQAVAAYDQAARIVGLESDVAAAFSSINTMAATPAYAGVSAISLDGLSFQNGIAETIVINVTSGFQVSDQLEIAGDASDLIVMRWDTDSDFANGYQGQVKFQSGGAIVPQGGLTPGNFVHVAGDINSSGGGSTPPLPYPQGPRFDNGQGALVDGGSDFSGGGFFTGYWLTTGDPSTMQTASLSNGIFVGGWYSTSTSFSMTSGTSGVSVCPPLAPAPTPTVTADPGATPDPAPTPDPEPTASQSPTEPPMPTPTEPPTSSPDPASSPSPTATPDPSATLDPSPLPDPSATPDPSLLPDPSATPDPSPLPDTAMISAAPPDQADGTGSLLVGTLVALAAALVLVGAPGRRFGRRSRSTPVAWRDGPWSTNRHAS